MEFFEVENRELCNLLINSSLKTADELLNYLQEKYNPSVNLQEPIRVKLSRYFMPTFTNRWKKAFSSKINREEQFLNRNKIWLDSKLEVSLDLSSSDIRQAKNFEKCSQKTKKRRIEALKQSVSGEEADFVKNFKTLDNKTAIEIVRKGIANDAMIMDAAPIQEGNVIPFTNDEALALYIDLKLTKNKYELLRKRLKGKNVDIFPPYKQITNAKNECYPSSSAINITETGATIKLQNLLDHTAARILKIESVELPTNTRNLKMTSKFGGDGTSGFNPYKQKFENSENSDESIFLMSLVPLRLYHPNDSSSTVIWKNLRPCSPKNCLPIMFEFAKETKTKILIEFRNIENQVKRLKPSKIEVNGLAYYVEHELHSTMIDGKVCQHITGTSSASNCTICGAKPSEMNNLQKVSLRTENVQSFKYGIQVLHQWLRQLECVLNISYRLNIKTWACRTNEEKRIRDEKKTYIKQEIRRRLGLMVDTPKQGAGTTNDGNTARKFFANYEIISEITGFDQELLKNLYIILQTLSSGKPINTKKFHEHALKTAELYIAKYSWCFMPASMHKVLIHGAKIIDSFVIPIGQLSEEAQEAKNKDFKRCRENNTRKTSRIDTNTDLLHYLLFSADLYLSSLRTDFEKPEKPLLPEAKALLLDITSDNN